MSRRSEAPPLSDLWGTDRASQGHETASRHPGGQERPQEPLSDLWGSPGPVVPHQPPCPDPDLTSLWGGDAPTSRHRNGPAQIAVVVSTVGGAGVSQLSLALARKAAQHLERVVLVDSTGDLRELLCAPDSSLPSFSDYALQGKAAAAMVTPAQLAGSWPQFRQDGFFAVLGPAAPLSALPLVDELAAVADVVIVDAGRADLTDGVLELFRFPSAFGVAVVDGRRIAFRRLFSWWSCHRNELAHSRWLVVPNRVHPALLEGALGEQAASSFGARLISPVKELDEVRIALDQGVPPSHPDWVRAVDQVFPALVGQPTKPSAVW